VQTIPSDPGAARKAFPWITYEGRWGELQEAFFNGPTGPNMKTQWTEPITWSEDWRDRAYAVPTSGVFGTDATDFFCSAVTKGSRGLVRLLRDPAVVLGLLALLLALVVFAVKKATWHPVAPLRVGRRRYWGQILSAAGVMYVKRLLLFVGIGVVLIPLTLVTAVVQGLLFGGVGMAESEVSGVSAGALVLLSVALGTVLTLIGFTLVQAATTCALVELDQGRKIGPIGAYRLALRRIGPLLGALTIAVVAWVLLSATWILLPLAIWIVVRWALFAQTVVLEGKSAVPALWRSGALVNDRWFRVASLVGVGALVALAIGPIVGAMLILLTSVPLPFLNVVAGVIYALVVPFVALTTSYVYFDARTRVELEPKEDVDELPAEIQLST
jgi:hypothetical protein